jgi:hypothetical protein
MREFRMLAACEMSGRVGVEFAKRGWDAWSCDLLPSEGIQGEYTVGNPDGWFRQGTYRHHQGDVRALFEKRHPVNYAAHLERQRYVDRIDGRVPLWDLVIAFPPCTDLCLAGAVWWKIKRIPGPNGEPSAQDDAASFFMEMANVNAPHVAVENPRGDMTRRWRPPDQHVQPYMFGDPLKKETGLWLKNLPLLYADWPVDPLPAGRVATGGGSWRTDRDSGAGPNNGHEDSEGRARRSIVRSRTLPGLARAMAEQWGTHIEALEER